LHHHGSIHEDIMPAGPLRRSARRRRTARRNRKRARLLGRAPVWRAHSGSYGAANDRALRITAVDEVFRGNVEFSNESPLYAAVAFGAVGRWRISISDTHISIEARWTLLRPLLQPRELRLDEIRSARLRASLVILYLDADQWWSISTATKGERIMQLLERRGIPVSRDP
jgi:hypothetical protein